MRTSVLWVVIGLCFLGMPVAQAATTTTTYSTSSNTTPDYTPTASNPGSKMTGIGIFAGAMTPVYPANKNDYDITESWGFFVNVPIVPHFHIMPQATIYRLKVQNLKDHPGWPKESGVTDLSINFKFNLPLNRWNLFAMPLMGISTGSFAKYDPVQAHIGAGLGFSVNLVSVLDFFMMTQYKFLIDEDQKNAHFFHTVAGLQFNL